jgi:alpha-1,6-mannosyltransferase
MLLQRHPVLDALLHSFKSAVDWVLPGALWSWDALVSFAVHSLTVAFVAYALAAWQLTRTKTLGLRWIIVPLVMMQLSLSVVPASLSTDIFNYAIYGEMPVLYGANPFVHTPAEFPQSPLYYLVPLYWHDAASVYGPLWVLISAGVAALFRSLPLSDELLFYRLIANGAHLANTVLVWKLARRLDPDGTRAPSAALAYGWNPYLLLDFSLNGHNDVLMLTFTLLAFWLASAHRLYIGALALGLAVATKYTSILVAPVLFIWSARTDPKLANLGTRALAVTLAGIILVGSLAVLYAPWLEGIDTFGPVLYWASGPRLQNFWPEPTLIAVTAWVSPLLGVTYDDLWDPLLAGFKVAAKGALVVYILVEAWRARTFDDVLAASARVMIVFVLFVNTWVMPWYYSWPLALVAPLGWSSMLVRVCACLTLTAPIIMYQRQFQYAVVGEWAGAFLVLPIAIAAVGLVWARRRARPFRRVEAGSLAGSVRP